MDMLTVTKVKKSFGTKKVIEDLSFSIPNNSIFGFVGQNGAGKTTTMKMILGLIKVDDGEILVDGKKVVYGNTPTNKVIGYLPDVPEFYNYMTSMEYLLFCGELTGMGKLEAKERANELLERVGLDKEKRRIKGFSRGMKQRLGIAQALMGRPKLLICDEPTSALDPVGRKELLDILQASKHETTIMFSTHILSDVERICDQVAFLHEGRLALSGTITDIKKINSRKNYKIVVSDENDVPKITNRFDNAKHLEGCEINLSAENCDSINEMMQFLVDNKISIEKIEKQETTLENLFMEVVTA